MVSSTDCCCRGPEFSFQHPYQRAGEHFIRCHGYQGAWGEAGEGGTGPSLQTSVGRIDIVSERGLESEHAGKTGGSTGNSRKKS